MTTILAGCAGASVAALLMAGPSVAALLVARLLARAKRLRREEDRRRQAFRAAVARIVAEESGQKRLRIVQGGRP